MGKVNAQPTANYSRFQVDCFLVWQRIVGAELAAPVCHKVGICGNLGDQDRECQTDRSAVVRVKNE